MAFGGLWGWLGPLAGWGQYYDEPAKSNMKMRKNIAHWRPRPAKKVLDIS